MYAIEQSKKRQTNSKDTNNYEEPLKIKFTPKQITQFETIRVPGMNNSGGNRYRKNGVQAQQYQIQEAKKKEEKILSRMEMRPTLKRQTTISEKLKGKKDEYKQIPQIVGMSGTDPVGEFVVEGIGLERAINGLIRLGKVAYNAYKVTGTKLGKNLLGSSSKKGFNYNDLPTEKYTYNDKTGNWDIDAPKKEWVQKGENELVPDYFVSPEEQQRLIASGLSPEEAAEIMQTRFTNSINARPGIFRNLGKNTYGESRVSGGYAQPVYNNRKGVKASLNDAKTTLNTVFHELGGHGSSLNGELSSFKLDNPLVKIMMHNEKLRPQLKPFYQAVKNGDFKLAEKLAPKDGSLKGINGTYNFKELQKFIKYMEENQEYSARAIGANMSNHYGMPNGWNEQQLREYFTEKSVNNLLKNVWNYGMPLTIGGYTLYDNQSNN